MEIYEAREDSYLLSQILKKEISILFKKKPNLKFLEIGCGSGIQIECILELGIKKENILCCDINLEAVKFCKRLGVNCIKSDLFENIKEKFDIIAFNPPYLPFEQAEPKSSRSATTGGKSGSEIINRFLKNAKYHLNKNGEIILLTSSLTKNINWNNYKKSVLGKKKLFFEELYVFGIQVV
jgi:release factor glutamine methyltransferase